ncbi:MAG: FAD-dependent oxidoreductase [Candidatus Scatosoma sp.]
MNTVKKDYGLVVIGGGLSGICCAVAAARRGVKTALLQDRSVLGGNASGEVRMHVCGADRHGYVPNARETGIIEELLLTNRYYNPQHSFSVQDTVFYDFVKKEKNLDLYLNTRAISCRAENSRIISVSAYQTSSETQFEFYAPFFADNSGDGTIAAQSGAKYVYGRESKAAYGEPHAPDEADENVMGSTIMFTAKDTGAPVPFVKPARAYDFSEDDLRLRNHTQITSGYWWLEVSGNLNTLTQSDEIYDELLNVLFGVWDHIKNKPGHNAENYALDWIGSVAGKRESRRFIGDYVLKETDLAEAVSFPDAVAYGGWNMDVHVPNGIFSSDKPATTYYPVKSMYGIPYRSLYSVNIENLFLGGRLISASHIAFGSTRVMGTCAVVGQAVGTAAAIAIESGFSSAREVGGKIGFLQQTLLKNDCYIPGVKNTDEADLAKRAKISATSEKQGCESNNIINGVARSVGSDANYYEGVNGTDDALFLRWDSPVTVKEISVAFDSDLSKELTITISDEVRNRQQRFPKRLAKDFDVTLFCRGTIVKEINVTNNLLRRRVFSFAPVAADKITLCVRSTHGNEPPRVFEVRVY